MSVAICTPARDQVSTGYAKSLANLTAKISKQGYKFELIVSLGTVISQLRIDLATVALKKGHEWILWLDSDMHFPDNTLERLMSHDKKIVAATYSTRYKPQRSVAFTNQNNYNDRLLEKTGLHEVWAVGMGCMLTHRSVFETLPRPWFNHEWDLRTESFMGEDLFFCKSAAEHGFDIFVDTDLSQETGHYGTKIFLLQETIDQQV
jgi:hypothetical protein